MITARCWRWKVIFDVVVVGGVRGWMVVGLDSVLRMDLVVGARSGVLSGIGIVHASMIVDLTSLTHQVPTSRAITHPNHHHLLPQLPQLSHHPLQGTN